MARTVVDGMNVIGSHADGWWHDGDAARRLLGRLQHAATRSRDAFTLVLDGGPPAELPEGDHDGVEVRSAGPRRGRDAADDRIVELITADSDPASLRRVVTSDRDLVDRVTALGATTEGAGAFLRRLDGLAA